MVEPILPMLLQIKEGLETFGFLVSAKIYPALFKDAFTSVGSAATRVKADSFLDAVHVRFSPDGSNVKEHETTHTNISLIVFCVLRKKVINRNII